MTPTPEQVAEMLEIWMREDNRSQHPQLGITQRETINQAAALIRDLAAREARMRAALEPLACFTGGFLGSITDADVARARAAFGDAP